MGKKKKTGNDSEQFSASVGYGRTKKDKEDEEFKEDQGSSF